jgi:shikimate dehydrogenase
MAGCEEAAWPVGLCRPGAIVADIVYRPLETALLSASRARALVAVDGLGMLIHQGALAFELWFGIKPDVSKARARLLAALSQ